MKLTVIGCWGAYPKQNEATSSYLIQTDNLNLLIDCGSGALSHLQNFLPLSKLDAVILSHYHTDHIADIYSLQYATMILTQLGEREKPLDIYAHNGDAEQFSTLHYKEYCRAHPIKALDTLRLSDLHIKFFPNVHPVPCLAMRIEQENGGTLAYTADTEWTEELLQLAHNVDLFLCEASLYQQQLGQIAGHLTAKQAGELAAKANVQSLLLTHLPQYGEQQQLLEEAKEAFAGRVELAQLGNFYHI